MRNTFLLNDEQHTFLESHDMPTPPRIGDAIQITNYITNITKIYRVKDVLWELSTNGPFAMATIIVAKGKE